MKDAKAIIIYSMTRIGVHFALAAGAIMLLAFVTIVLFWLGIGSTPNGCPCIGLSSNCRNLIINPTLFLPARLR